MSSFTSFRNNGFRSRRIEDDGEDPMSGLANLADCMLVLACGLMVALVVAWNIDITKVTEVSKTDTTQEISDLETITDNTNAGGDAYIDMGRVYQDPETGKLYMVEGGSSSDSSSDSGEAASGSDAAAGAAAGGSASGSGDSGGGIS